MTHWHPFLLSLLLSPALVVAQDGALDTTFADGGIAVGPLFYARAGHITLDDQQRILVAGTAAQLGGSGAAAFASRYTPEGERDAAFANGGLLYNGLPGAYTQGGPIVALPDGSYLRSVSYPSSRTVYASRVLADGSQTCFALVSGSAFTSAVGGAAVTPEGDVVLAVRRPDRSDALSVVKVDVDYTDGSCARDTTFGLDGRVDIRLPGRWISTTDVGVQRDGRLVVSAWMQLVPAPIVEPRALVARLTPGGALDPTFGPGGQGYNTLEGDETLDLIPYTVALGPDGTAVLAGEAGGDGEKRWFALRVHSDGSLDSAFGNEGVVLLPTTSGPTSRALDVTVDRDGRPVLVGDVGSAWGVARLSSVDGAPDPSFGTDGFTVLRPFDATGRLDAVALQPDGRIVAAGYLDGVDGPSFTVARFLGGTDAVLRPDLEPVAAPVVLPPGGGAFAYTATLTNGTALPRSADAWITATLPDGSAFGPVAGPRHVTLPPGASVVRTSGCRYPRRHRPARTPSP